MHVPVIMSASQVRTAARLPVDPKTTEIRIYASAFTIICMALLLMPAFSVLTNTESPVMQVARLSGWPQLVGVVFLTSALGMLPHLCALVFAPSTLGVHWPRQVAAAATSIASLLWCYLANLAEPLDLPTVEAMYWAQAFICSGCGFLYALSLNGQQVLENDSPAVG